MIPSPPPSPLRERKKERVKDYAMIEVKKSVLELPAYEVLQQARIKLNQNESPYDIPVTYKRKILQLMQKKSWNRYPSNHAEALKNAIAQYTKFPAKGIIVGNGSNELILAIMLTICDRGDQITTVSPGFAIYSYLGRILNLQNMEIPLNPDFSFSVTGIIKHSHNSKIIFLASPNNPTGTMLRIQEIEEITKKCKCLVVIDEAYYEFSRISCQHLLERYENIVVLRTFSKAFGLAGIRLGYLLGNKRIVSQIEKAKLPFSVGIFQQTAATFLLQHNSIVKKTAQEIISQRERVFNALNMIDGITPVPSKANFILFSIDKMGRDKVYEQLYKNGILLRRFIHPALKNMLRVTIGTPRENQLFLKAISRIIKKGGCL